MNQLWTEFKRKARDIRPFLRTKVGTILTTAAVVEFLVLFIAPLLHGFVGTAFFGCVAGVYLTLIWRRYDKDHAIVPAVILCFPMLLDMFIFHTEAVVVAYLVSIVAMLFVALSPLLGFFDDIADKMTAFLSAGAICAAVVILAWLTRILVEIAWWILCIVAFIVVVAVFLGLVYSTAAYTATDGKRQARRDRERREAAHREREHERDYRPRRRDDVIYDLDDDEYTMDRSPDNDDLPDYEDFFNIDIK